MFKLTHCNYPYIDKKLIIVDYQPTNSECYSECYQEQFESFTTSTFTLPIFICLAPTLETVENTICISLIINKVFVRNMDDDDEE